MLEYDLVVLGTGNAGRAAATVARKAGRSVAIVEGRDAPGGTCPLRGCVPKKVLVAAAQTLQKISDAGRHGIDVPPAKLDWAKLIARERGYVEGNAEAIQRSLEEESLDYLQGTARFSGRQQVKVDGQTLAARNFVIATGSVPQQLPFSGAEHLMTNEDVFAETHLPASVIFVGGGLVATEFAHVYTRAGVEVTILERGPRLLKRMDGDAVERLRAATEELGIEILTETEVRGIERDAEGYSVHYERNGGTERRSAERVVHGAGRSPAVESLDLDAAGIAHDGPKIEIDQYLASVTNPEVYVAGDANANSAQLSPLATHEGATAGRNIVEGRRHVPEYESKPAVVYTVPALAMVGLTQAECEARRLDAEVLENDVSDWFSASLYGDPHAYAKVLVHRNDRRILGAHLLGQRAEEIIHLFALAIRFGITADNLAEELYAFPTFSSEVKAMVG